MKTETVKLHNLVLVPATELSLRWLEAGRRQRRREGGAHGSTLRRWRRWRRWRRGEGREGGEGRAGREGREAGEGGAGREGR